VWREMETDDALVVAHGAGGKLSCLVPLGDLTFEPQSEPVRHSACTGAANDKDALLVLVLQLAELGLSFLPRLREPSRAHSPSAGVVAEVELGDPAFAIRGAVDAAISMGSSSGHGSPPSADVVTGRLAAVRHVTRELRHLDGLVFEAIMQHGRPPR